MRKNKTWLLCMVCFLLAATILPVTAFAKGAVDTEHPASLTVTCVHDGRKLAGVTFDLYQAAEMDDYGRYTLADAFSGYSVSLEQESAAGWRALAETLAQYARRDNVSAIRQAVTDSTGQVSFSELRVGMYLVYGYRYASSSFVYTPEPFLVSLPSLDENDDWFYDVEASCKGEDDTNPPDTATMKVLKVWDDKGHESNRPTNIEVQLLCNDRVYDTVTLHAGNNWRHTWMSLDADNSWSVVEKEVPENYTLLVNHEGITFVLTNTYEPAQNNGNFTITNTYAPPPSQGKPKLPQTGQLWWPIPVLIGTGLVSYLIGFLWRKTRKSYDE